MTVLLEKREMVKESICSWSTSTFCHFPYPFNSGIYSLKYLLYYFLSPFNFYCCSWCASETHQFFPSAHLDPTYSSILYVKDFICFISNYQGIYSISFSARKCSFTVSKLSYSNWKSATKKTKTKHCCFQRFSLREKPFISHETYSLTEDAVKKC